MKRLLMLITALSLVAGAATAASATVLIGGSVNNGNMDRTHATEIVPDFFLPKPNVWVYEGFRTISGPFEDALSSEPWAGPAPTPVTTDGLLNDEHPAGCGGPDCGVFFKPFTGNPNDGAATAHLSQVHPATPGLLYTLTGWAGAEANYLGQSEFAVEFLDAGNGLIGGSVLDLNAAGLSVPNDEPFNYKEYTVSAVAPAGTVNVRARVSMLDAMANPAGGGQAFVVDDFTLTVIPEPTSLALGLLGLVALLGLGRRR